MEYKVTLSENGRIILPVKIRKELNLVPGDHIMLSLNGSQVQIRTLKDTIRNFQEIVKAHNVNKISLVDSLKQSRTEDND